MFTIKGLGDNSLTLNSYDAEKELKHYQIHCYTIRCKANDLLVMRKAASHD